MTLYKSNTFDFLVIFQARLCVRETNTQGSIKIRLVASGVFLIGWIAFWIFLWLRIRRNAFDFLVIFLVWLRMHWVWWHDYSVEIKSSKLVVSCAWFAEGTESWLLSKLEVTVTTQWLERYISGLFFLFFYLFFLIFVFHWPFPITMSHKYDTERKSHVIIWEWHKSKRNGSWQFWALLSINNIDVALSITCSIVRFVLTKAILILEGSLERAVK